MAVVDPTKSTDLPKFDHRVADLTGKRFTRLTVIEFAGRNKHNLILWRCLCDCGNEAICSSYSLQETIPRRAKRSCGCLGRDSTSARSKTHGMTHTPTFSSWRGMLHRCEVATATGFDRYGGRGISVCERWHNFADFFADMGVRPSLNHQIERKDNNGNYEPSNCVWATKKEQARNRRSNRLLTHKGESLPVSVWAERAGLTTYQVINRLNLGWEVERALTAPVRSMRSRIR